MINPKTGKKWKVFLGIPTTGEIHDFLPYVLRDWAERYKDEIDFVYPERLCQRIFHDAARNGVVEDFFETDADILWMIDSDIAPPKHAPDLITMHGDQWLAAGCPYPVFMAQPGQDLRQVVFTVYKGVKDGRAMVPAPVPHSGTDWLDGIATGCLLLKREVFDRLEKPYFEFKFDPLTRQPIQGEDLGFCIKLHKLGIKFFTDYSMVCKHQKKVCLLEINNYCIDFANKSVQNYDNMVRGKVEELETRVKRMSQAQKSRPTTNGGLIFR